MLEGGGREEGIRIKGCFGDSQKDINKTSRLFAFFEQGFVITLNIKAVDDVSGQVIAIMGVRNLYFREHLTNDSLKMLVVDILPLRTIDLLYF